MATCILANWWLGGEEDIPGQECSLGQEMLVPKVFYLPLGPHQCWWKVTKQWRKKQRRENGERPFFLVMLLELRNRVNKDWFMVVVRWHNKGLWIFIVHHGPWILKGNSWMFDTEWCFVSGVGVTYIDTCHLVLNVVICWWALLFFIWLKKIKLVVCQIYLDAKTDPLYTLFCSHLSLQIAIFFCHPRL